MNGLEALFRSEWGPLAIFCLRILDVSIGTVRTLLLVRGARLWVPVLAFLETVIWVAAIGGALANLTSAWHLLAYAGGFAAGNLAGLWLEDRLAYGYALATILSRDPVKARRTAESLRGDGFGVTEIRGRGLGGRVDMLISAVRRRDVARLRRHAESSDPDSVLLIEEPRALHGRWILPREEK